MDAELDYKGHMGHVSRALRRLEQIVAAGPSAGRAGEAEKLLVETLPHIEGACRFVATGSNGHVSAKALESALKLCQSLIGGWNRL